MRLLLSTIFLLVAAVPIAAQTSNYIDNSAKIAEMQRKLAEQCRTQPGRCRDGPAAEPIEWEAWMAPNGSGSGFLVTKDGYVLTNHHVIDYCTAVTVQVADESRRNAKLRAIDEWNDLALLKLPGTFSNAAKFRESRRAVLGEPVLVAGFPLREFLSEGLNVSTGTVSSLAGYRNDPRFLQVSAPVQPGNSGGPVLDESATIIGVVKSTIVTIGTLRNTGAIPQNVNFAIKAAIARAFLDIHGIDYQIIRSSKVLDGAKIAAAAQKFTVLVECWK